LQASPLISSFRYTHIAFYHTFGESQKEVGFAWTVNFFPKDGKPRRKDLFFVVLSGSESDCHPEERSEEGSGLVLALWS